MGRIGAWLIALATAGTAAWAQSPQELKTLIERGNAQAAYDLARQAPERLGTPEFDLHFGIAAIAAGHPTEGVLALERLLLVDPRNERARFELARGYFAIGDDARAREEFEAALAARPPAAVASAIREYLEALRERSARHKPTIALHVEAGGGYDSNPRAGVDNPVLTLPVLGEVTIGEAGVRASDRVGQAAAGFRATAPLSARTVGFAVGEAQAIAHRKQDDFDQNLYAGSLGVLGQWGRQSWRAGGSRGYQTLGGLPYRHTRGLFVDWGFAPDERNALTIGVQSGKLLYAAANAVRDSDFATLALGWRHGWQSALRPVLDAGITWGRERNIHDERQDLSREIYGARLAMAASPWIDWTVNVAALYQRSRYREPDPLLETRRIDRYGQADLGIAWHLSRDFSLRVEVTEARNESNVALYEYQRRTAILRGRYDFR